MRILLSTLMIISLSAFAQTTPQPKTESAVEMMVKKSKKDRKKKVEMCHECGKPEEHCDCKGEEHKNDK